MHDSTIAALETHALLDSWYLHVFLGDFQLLLMSRNETAPVRGIDVEVRKAGLLLDFEAVRMMFAKDQEEQNFDLIAGKDEKRVEVVHRPSGTVVRVLLRGDNDLFLSSCISA